VGIGLTTGSAGVGLGVAGVLVIGFGVSVFTCGAGALTGVGVETGVETGIETFVAGFGISVCEVADLGSGGVPPFGASERVGSAGLFKLSDGLEAFREFKEFAVEGE
jgi:hypothetical protein